MVLLLGLGQAGGRRGPAIATLPSEASCSRKIARRPRHAPRLVATLLVQVGRAAPGHRRRRIPSRARWEEAPACRCRQARRSRRCSAACVLRRLPAASSGIRVAVKLRRLQSALAAALRPSLAAGSAGVEQSCGFGETVAKLH